MDLQKRPGWSRGKLSLQWGVIACWALGMSPASHAYTYLATDGGVPVRLSASRTLALQGRVASVFDRQMKAAVATWAPLAGLVGRLGFFLTDPTPSVNFDELSIVSFASGNVTGRALLGPQVIAATQVWYDTASGEILETDMVFNDQNFVFEADSRWTTRHFAVNSPALIDGRRVSFYSVMTHEMGHALGLSHSGEIDSTMLPVEGPDQSLLNCDDVSGIQALYAQGPRAGLSGRILSPSGQPLFGAQVSVASVTNQRIQATTITKPDGRFTVEGLPAGSYIAWAEPFRWGASSLPLFYKNIQPRVCDTGVPFAMTPIGVGADLARQEIVSLPAFQLGEGQRLQSGDTQVLCANEVAYSSAFVDVAVNDGVGGFLVRPASSYGSGQIRFPVLGDWNVKALTQSVSSRYQVQWGFEVKGGQEPWFQTPSGSLEEDRGGVAEHVNALTWSWGAASSSMYSSQILSTVDPGLILLARQGAAPIRRCSVQGTASGYRAPGGTGRLEDVVNGSAGCGTVRNVDTQPKGKNSSRPSPFQHWGFTFLLELAAVWLVRWKGWTSLLRRKGFVLD